MRNKVAVFANGWGDKNLTQTLEGMRDVATGYNEDIFVFLTYDSSTDKENSIKGEISIFELPDLELYDAAIIFTNVIYDEKAVEDIVKRARLAKIPVMTVGIPVEGTDFVGIDNKKGMHELVEHMINVHHIKDVVFLGGPKTNAESNQRLSAVRECMNENGLSLKDDNVAFGNWNHYWSVDQAVRIAGREKLPDVVFCANDYMAMSFMTGLIDRGISVPRDMLVTGFDYIRKGQNFFPSITTVEQNFYEVGRVGMSKLMSKISEGRNDLFYELVPTKFRCSESCGCMLSPLGIEEKRRMLVEDYMSFMEETAIVDALSDIDEAILKCEKASDIRIIAQKHLHNNHKFEGDSFYLVENGRYLNTVNGNLCNDKPFDKCNNVVVAMNNGMIEEENALEDNELIPGYSRDAVSHIYIFQTLHIRDQIFGYYVMRDNLKRIADRGLFRYSKNLEQCLDKIRQNLKLNELNKKLIMLYNRDSLTELYNRTGFDSVGLDYFNECVAEGQRMVIMFADVNQMKMINDNFGHIQGDLALRTVSQIIKNTVPEDWITVRYGGDEFAVIGRCDDEKFALQMRDEIEQKVMEQKNVQSLPYELATSCGYVMTDIDSDKSLGSYIREADQIMYERKEKFYRDRGMTSSRR